MGLGSRKDTTILITGAGRGIGKRLAIGFAQAGFRVGLLGRSQGELAVTKLQIEHAGGPALRTRAHVIDYERVAAGFVEWGGEGGGEGKVQINWVFPGEAYTSMTDEILKAGPRAGPAETEHAEKVRLTGGISPEKQIQLALFLASERSNHVT